MKILCKLGAPADKSRENTHDGLSEIIHTQLGHDFAQIIKPVVGDKSWGLLENCSFSLVENIIAADKQQ
jgi:hypothetical protein